MSAMTAWDNPQFDLPIAVTDTPDPVGPDQNITYSMQVTQAGPDTATNVNAFNNGSLRYQSINAPPGFTCTPLAVGATPTMTCETSSLALGASAEIIVTVRTDPALTGPMGGTFSTAFSTGSAISDPLNANNAETENTLVIPVLLFANGFE